MPEGDTIHTYAAELDRRLRGRTLRVGTLRDRPDVSLAGRTVRGVRAHGKHLFVELDGDLWIQSHLGLHGTWHGYAPGEPWQRPRHHAHVVLETDDDVLVCFQAAEAHLQDAAGHARFTRDRDLGPDLVQAAPELDVLLRRARRFLLPEAPLVDLLLDQRVAAGIGNVYKSELCFLHRLSPFVPVSALAPETVRALFDDAHRLLRENTGRWRSTRDVGDGRGRTWVYRRGGEPCFTCGTPIRRAIAGRGRRSTYWCPECQATPG